MWQSLAFGPKYKSAYCQAVCPAGEDVIGPYMADKAAWRNEVMVPLLRKEENVYVTSGSRAERVARRNRSKRVRYIDYRPELSTPANFVLGLRHRFDPSRAVGTTVVVEFAFPDGGSTVASIEGGGLQLDADTPATRDATVALHGDRYIRLLHPESADQTTTSPTYTLAGDPAALGSLLACMS